MCVREKECAGILVYVCVTQSACTIQTYKHECVEAEVRTRVLPVLCVFECARVCVCVSYNLVKSEYVPPHTCRHAHTHKHTCVWRSWRTLGIHVRHIHVRHGIHVRHTYIQTCGGARWRTWGHWAHIQKSRFHRKWCWVASS